ncbi:TonB-dependent receptor [Parabacteroides sp. PF5-6]|uniref:SusC/RagA family TonB-linked outer membrane protein n=1 Tax=Parabacteroides sp. PF5-6 TaxID=1742403 RepID=UPI0024055591|nr:TonB-dependent receptor [Parabacteroides sp. PF5-6]MDF9828735.1 TonB-linked SusC/RagA family outer membrane protein [Parabacteroides sp. PF5-6]
MKNHVKKSTRPLLVFLLLCVLSVHAFGQQVTVSGTITDRVTGEPLPGVNVVVSGTTTGISSDIDGKYSLAVPSGNVKLVFTYIGYDPVEVETRGSQTMNVTMVENNTQLEEVVVIGYGTMTRKDVTSSITTVTSEKMNVGVYSDPAQLLQGKVPGLVIAQSSDPNATASITLRGASTLREGAAMEPYYVIDGMPGMSLSLISPNDIESIDVLRDATATAIYGSKAANGVIIVTTKKGQAGRTNIDYNGYVAVDNVMGNYEMMTGPELRAYAQSGGIALMNDLGYDTNWQDEVQRTGFSQNHNVSISGGTDQLSFSGGVNYMENQGVIKGSDMTRLIGRAYIQAKGLKDRLTVSFNINASVTNRSRIQTSGQGMSVLDAIYYYSPLVPVRNEDNTYYEDPSITQYYNPVALINENINDTEGKRLMGTGKASLKIVEGLIYNASLAYQNEQYIYSTYNSSRSLVAQNMNGRARRSSVTNKRTVFETYLNYDKTFNKVHKLGLMAGYSWEESNDNDGFQLTTYDYYNDDLTYYNMGMANKIEKTGLGDYNLSTLRMISFYGRINYSYASKYLFQATLRRDGSSAFGKNNRWGTFPSVSLAWRLYEEDFIKNLNVFDDLKLRVGYGVSGNSMGFDVFTATQLYGSTGWYDHLTTTGQSDQIQILGATRNANPDLKWERTGMFNVGLDFGFFNNRLSGTIEYYDKRTKDLIADYAVSTAKYPFATLTANVGEISNKGIELTLNATPVQEKDFRWETSINLSHNKNEVVSISNQMYSVDYFDKGGVQSGGFSGANVQRVMAGYPMGQFYTWKWAGVKDGVSHFYVYGEDSLNDIYKEQGGFEGKVTKQDDGRYIDNATGEYVTTKNCLYSDKYFAGSAQPKLSGGWNNTFTYKKWTLTAFMQGVVGNKVMNATRANLNNLGNVTVGKNVLASVAKEIPTTDNNAHAPSDRYLENASYLRLASLSLAYNFGKINDYIRGLRLYATCNNVFTITGYKGIDPEVSLGGIAPGIDNRQTYPRTRTFMFGVNVNF